MLRVSGKEKIGMRYERFRPMNARAPTQVLNPTDYRAGASAASDHWVYISSRDRVTFATMAQVAGEPLKRDGGVVQPICKHPTHPSPGWGEHTPVAGLGLQTPGGRAVMSHAGKQRTGF